VAALALSALLAPATHAADQTILGSGFQVKNPGAIEKRQAQVKAKEKASLNTIVGNPVTSGATLTVRANGTSPSSQVFALPQGMNAKGKPFWSGDATKGFKYNDSKSEQGAVKAVKISKSGSGVFQIQAKLSGKVVPLNVLPPNIGTDACAFLQITGGDSYSVKFAPGEGVITNKGAQAYAQKKVTSEGGCGPTCSDGIQNQSETGIDCGGPNCGGCNPGGGCVLASDCLSGVCSLGICQAPSCVDAVQNGTETGIDCGGGICAPCGFGGGCSISGDCQTNHCSGGACKCANHNYTFAINSNVGGFFDSAEWPGGTASQTFATGCTVIINRPAGNIDIVGGIGNGFSVNNDGNYSNCFGFSGEDGDGCAPGGCPPAGIGSCQSARPSCSAALNGSASAAYFVQCLE